MRLGSDLLVSWKGKEQGDKKKKLINVKRVGKHSYSNRDKKKCAYVLKREKEEEEK